MLGPTHDDSTTRSAIRNPRVLSMSTLQFDGVVEIVDTVELQCAHGQNPGVADGTSCRRIVVRRSEHTSRMEFFELNCRRTGDMVPWYQNTSVERALCLS